jgi:DNA-binding response OmpR family regulator
MARAVAVSRPERKEGIVAAILIVDDETKLRALLSRDLSAAGHQPVQVADGETACDYLDSHTVDLVLLDLVMPGVDGLTVLKHVNELSGAPPVVVLSGVGHVGARVQAINGGAVDYVTKPFVLAELMARVNRHLGTPHERFYDGRYLAHGELRLDTHRRVLILPGEVRPLSERETAVLAQLLRRRGDVCTRDELLHDIWGYDFDPGSNVLEVCVGRLRTKLPCSTTIETVRGVGYCITGD